MFVLLQVVNVELVKEGLGVSIKVFCVERNKPAVVLHGRVSDLTHGEDVLFTTNVEALIIHVHDAKSLSRFSLFAKLNKKRKYVIMLDEHSENCSVAFVGRSGVDRQEL